MQMKTDRGLWGLMHTFINILMLAVVCESQTASLRGGLAQEERDELERRQFIKKCPDNTINGVPTCAKDCNREEPACTKQISIFDECVAQYGTDLKYMYCLCTAGHEDASNKCSQCKIDAGLETYHSFYSDLASWASRDCASYSVKYGNTTSTTTVAQPTGPFLSGLIATLPGATPSSGAQTARQTGAASKRPSAYLKMTTALAMYSLLFQ